MFWSEKAICELKTRHYEIFFRGKILLKFFDDSNWEESLSVFKSYGCPFGVLYWENSNQSHSAKKWLKSSPLKVGNGKPQKTRICVGKCSEKFYWNFFSNFLHTAEKPRRRAAVLFSLLLFQAWKGLVQHWIRTHANWFQCLSPPR